MATPPNRHSPNREKEHRMRPLASLLWAGTASLALVGAAQAQPAEDTIVVGLSRRHHHLRAGQHLVARQRQHRAAHLRHALHHLRRRRGRRPTWPRTSRSRKTGCKYVYTLREGLTCHDGEALTAEDVAYTFNRAKDPANQFTGNTPGFVFSSVGFASAEALDDRRVQINIARKNPIAFGLLAEVYIHCKDSYEKMTLDQAAREPGRLRPLQARLVDARSEVVLEKVENPNARPTSQKHRLADHPRSLDPLGRTDRRQRRHHHQRGARPDRRGQRLGQRRRCRRCRARAGSMSASTCRTSSRPRRAARRSRTRPCAAPCSTRSTCRRSASSF